MLRDWRLKRGLIRPFAASHFGEEAYEWLTAVALGTQRGLSRKWCYWFREHLVLSRRYAKTRLAGGRLWLCEPGWSVAPMVLSYVVTGRGPLVTEPRSRLARRYLSSALAQAAAVAPQMCRSAASAAPDPALVDALCRLRSPRRVLARCEVDYRVCDLRGLQALPSGSADLCLSMGRLEHYSEKELGVLLAQMRRVLAPNGVGSHIVDHRDHFWHFDKSGHCFRHLTYSDEEWQRLARGRKLYRNRLLEGDYVRLFDQAGFDVLARVHHLHREDAAGVEPSALWGRYRELSREDLSAAVSHFVVLRR